MKTIASIILLVVSLTAAHAASTQAERDEFTREAEKVLRPGTFALFIIPPSTGALNESVVGGFAAVSGPSRLVKDAANTLRECRKRKLDLAVAGKTEVKCRATMIAALKSLKEEKLQGMTIYYLIPPDTDLAVRTEALGAKPVFKKPNQTVEPTPGDRGGSP